MTAIKKNDLIFHPTLADFSSQRTDKVLTVLAGANNTGKSLVLKWLKHTLGRTAYMIGTNRFYHVYHFSTAIRDPNQINSFENQFNNQFSQEDYNYEQNFFDLNSIIVGLTDKQRITLFELCGDLIGSTFSLKKVIDENELSPRYIDMDGQNLSVGSTGTRLLMTILGICMDHRYSSILIDEPELGLGPRVQQALSSFLQDGAERRNHFPHLNRVFLATHSHLFLSRVDITNNFVINKTAKDIYLSQVNTISDFHRLQFNLLGNSLESMFFPSSIVVVEGKTDDEYIDRVLQLHFSARRITVIPANGDVKRKVAGIREAFGDLMKSPIRDRLFVVLDQVHQPDLSSELQRMGVQADNIICWKNNGIEFVYPTSIMASIFSCSVDEIQSLAINGDRVELNGITKTKNDLKNEVLKVLDSKTPLPEELQRNLLSRISRALS